MLSVEGNRHVISHSPTFVWSIATQQSGEGASLDDGEPDPVVRCGPPAEAVSINKH